MWRQLAITGSVVALIAGLAGAYDGAVTGMTPAANAAPYDAAPFNTAPVLPLAPFDGLQARTGQATADASAAGAAIAVAVLDRTTGEFVSNGAGQAFPIASVVKLFIADDVLLRESRGEIELSPAQLQSLDLMLRSSDDSAAQTFWDLGGGNAVIARVKARYGLAGTIAPYDGGWDVAQSTAGDLVRYYQKLMDGSGGLPREQADFILGNLSRFTASGVDGYPQRFGIPDGLYAEPVAVKQGWFCCWGSGNQVHVSTGVIGSDRRYVMAISSLQPTDAATARATITEAVKTMFPGGQI